MLQGFQALAALPVDTSSASVEVREQSGDNLALAAPVGRGCRPQVENDNRSGNRRIGERVASEKPLAARSVRPTSGKPRGTMTWTDEVYSRQLRQQLFSAESLSGSNVPVPESAQTRIYFYTLWRVVSPS